MVSANNTYRDLDYPGRHKNRMSNVVSEENTNTPSNGAQFDIVLGNRALCAQPRDQRVIC